MSHDDAGASRRDLFHGVAGVAAGLLAGCATAPKPAAGTAAQADGTFALPGPHPGKVVEVHDPASVDAGRIDGPRAAAMLDRALVELTGAPDAASAWRQFVSPGDRVGLKVNCVGHAVSEADKHAVVTSHEMLRAIITSLRAIGVDKLLIFDRYRMEFEKAKYPELAGELGVPWEVSAISWDESQIDLDGYSKGDPSAEERNAKARTDGSPKPSGYDPEHHITLDFVHPVNDPANPRARRSHVSNIVTKKVDKIINLCLVKDHMSAGMTGALKNLSHGLVDNVCRSHSRSSLNQTATFIPAVVSLPIIRRKVVLNVMEGFRGIYHFGPWASQHVFEPRSLFVSTDPVAMDRIAMDLIDARRAEDGLPPVAKSGKIAAKGEDEQHLFRGGTHVEIAGAAGLGVYARTIDDWKRWYGRDPATMGRPAPLIDHRIVKLG